MTNPSNPSPRGTGGSAKVPSSTIHNRSTSQGSTATSPHQASLNADGEKDSISSVRKRDKFLNFFRSSKSKDKTKDNSVTGTQFSTGTSKARSDVFFENVSRPAASIEVPKIGSRFNSTPQLALCSSLLRKSQYVQDQGAQDYAEDASQVVTTNQAHLDWVNAVEKDTVEQDRIRLLGTRMVEEFSKDAVKISAAISEVVLLGPVLDHEHYRKLLNCFISEFKKAEILDIHLLQGLIQLVQCASEGYLVADDLVKILKVLRAQLQNTHQQAPEHPYHLTLAVSRLLDVMAEHKVQDVRRVEDHEPLSEILSGLRNSSDPYLMYQVSYAFQALQYVPDDETPLQAVLRHSAGVAESVVKISGVIKLDLSSALDGLKGFQATLNSTCNAVKVVYEGVQSLRESGRGLLDSLKDGLSAGQKRLWYLALRVADGFVRQGQLVDLNRLIADAPCRRDPLFQWGICQLLGEIAADEDWEVTIRLQAMELLVDLCSNDEEWAQDESVKSWMLAIIEQLGIISDPAIKNHAKNLLNDLKSGYSLTAHTYPLKAHLPMPVSSDLLTRVQGIPFVEDDLQQLKRQRLEEHKQPVYIPPLAKPNQQAPDSDVLPLMDKVVEFLESERQVMLILGDSGAGKSTFNRYLEYELWREYKSGGRIPLFINMPALRNPESELIAEQLRMHQFSETQIRELERQRQLIVICDGYDESQLTINIHITNQLNRPGRWNVKLVVSCRSQYLGHDYYNRFVPQGSDHYSVPALDLFQEAVITPFSRSQIEDYVKQYVPLEPRPWVTKDYMDKLTTIPNLMDLVTNPFLLTLSLGALPSVVKNKKDLKNLRITRVALYDSFVHHWIGANKRRLEKQQLEKNTRGVLDELIEDNFERIGIEYQKNLASAIFQEQDGKPVVDYTHRRDKQSWKAKFFGPEPEPTLLRSCSLLIRVGNQHRFIHRSILEYFQSRFLYEPDNDDDDDDSSPATNLDTAAYLQQPIADHPLSQRSLVGEPSIVQFLCERVQEDVAYKDHLLAIIEQSKTDPAASQAASNAITILVRAGVMFNGADLQGIQIPGADLSGGQFDTAQLQGADLRNTNLRNIWLRQANLSKAQMAGVHFGEWPFLQEEDRVNSCAYSPDGKTLAVGLENGTISLYNTASWEAEKTLSGHTQTVMSIVFSPSGQQIASGSSDDTVRLWDAQTGAPGAILRGHTRQVTGVVFSPSGQQIASGSDDYTVRLWNVQPATPSAILSGQASWVTSVVFSPSGQQIASGSYDSTVRLWDAQTGAPGAILSGHIDWVTSVVFSPSGQQIASGSYDNTVRLWDAQTGASGAILSGHTDWVTSAVFSPSGQQIASGSEDKTVRLWEAQTGAPGAILRGHTDRVTSVVFSPNGQQIASGSKDKTVRLWDTQTGAPGAIFSGHTSWVMSVVFSPSGQQIASGSRDMTVRLWDPQNGTPGVILSGHTDRVTSVVFSPSRQQIASGGSDDTVRLWDAQTGAPGAILRGHTRQVTGVVFSPSGQQIASGSDDYTVRLWDAQIGAPGTILSGHTSCVMSVVFSPSGQQIASGSMDNTVRLWDAQTGAPGAILSGHTDWVTSVVFSPSGQQLASGSYDNTVRIWDAQTGAPGVILSGHTACVMSVVFSPSGQQIVLGSYDNTVRLWDAKTGAPDAILIGHTGWVTSVVFSPSGQQIASGSSDRTMRLWDVDSGRCLTVVNGFYGIVSTVAWNEYGDSSYIATGCGDKSIRLWQVIGGHHLINLRWSSMHNQLAASDTSIVSVQGLSKMNIKLLVQRGAIGQPMSLKEPKAKRGDRLFSAPKSE